MAIHFHHHHSLEMGKVHYLDRMVNHLSQAVLAVESAALVSHYMP